MTTFSPSLSFPARAQEKTLGEERLVIDPSLWRGSATLKGAAAAQGSKRLGRNHATGEALLLDASKKTRPWRDRLAAEMRKNAPSEPLDLPVFVRLDIYIRRPRSHYGTGRNADRLRPGMPTVPATGLDIDKVARACLDAGTSAGWWRNDSRVASLSVHRYYADDEERVVVSASPLTGTVTR